MNRHIVLGVLLLCIASSIYAQHPTGKVVVQGGRKHTVMDTLPMDSLQKAQRDSLMRADSLSPGSKITPVTPQKENATFDEQMRKRFSLTRDTIKPGALVALSLIPGMGQVYNRQWWKVPIIYSALGGFTAAGFYFNNQARVATLKWQDAINNKKGPDVTNPLKSRMMNNNTATTVMFALAGATYFYQLADATFNYRGNTNHIRKATILAALFPGAGFIYTKTYWRLPIYYGGMAALGTVVDYNNRSYERFNRAWEIVVANDPNVKDEFNGRYSADVLKNAKDAYRRNRDFGIICLVGVYALSIIDTYVIATLKNWDVTPNLGVTITPTTFSERLGQNSAIPSGAGLSLSFRF